MRPGERLGPYELLSPIGSGGMGEVWKARDTRLDRTVAIKHSAERFSDRFEREAHAIAALNHPHICTLYDVGPDYLVMEFVDGKPLRGPLPLKQALAFGAQIADALHCAHSKGVVHRDLKPANVLVTKAGVKLLDFGLARIAGPARVPETTVTLGEPLTKDHVILGTLQYMSPEQLEGRPADSASDIFAFGLVLYELICGRPAFQAQSQASLIAAILKEEPAPLPSLEPVTPPALDWLVRKCLAKDPETRWQSAADLRDELEWIAHTSAEGGATPAVNKGGGWRNWRLWSSAAVAAAVLLFAAVRVFSPPPVTTWAGDRLGGPEFALGPRISPDGHTLAFQAIVGQNTQVAVMKPESGNWQVLTHKSDAGWVNEISWSPDGNKIYYDRFVEVPRGVYSVPALGGDEQPVLEDAFAPEALPDGSLLVVKMNDRRGFQVFRFWPDSGRLQGYPAELNSSWGPTSVINSTLLRASRDGKEAFAVCRLMTDPDKTVHLFRIDLESGEVSRVHTGPVQGEAILGLAPGLEGDTILAGVQSSELVRVVAFPRKANSAPRTLFTVTNPVPYLDSGPGGVIYADQWSVSGVLLRFPREGGQTEKIGFLPAGYAQTHAVLGRRLVFLVVIGSSRSRLMILEPGKDPAPLLNTTETLSPPLAATGPAEVAVVIGPDSARSIALVSAANGRISRRIPFDKGMISSLAASPDGQTLYCAAAGAIWSISQEGELRKICAGDQVAAEPDGRSLVVKMLETPRARLMRVPLDGTPPREITLTGPLHPGWQNLVSEAIGADGVMVLPLLSPDSWFSVPGTIDLGTGKTARLPVDRFGDYPFLSRTPEGRILAVMHDYRCSVWRFRPEAR